MLRIGPKWSTSNGKGGVGPGRYIIELTVSKKLKMLKLNRIPELVSWTLNVKSVNIPRLWTGCPCYHMNGIKAILYLYRTFEMEVPQKRFI